MEWFLCGEILTLLQEIQTCACSLPIQSGVFFLLLLSVPGGLFSQEVNCCRLLQASSGQGLLKRPSFHREFCWVRSVGTEGQVLFTCRGTAKREVLMGKQLIFILYMRPAFLWMWLCSQHISECPTSPSSSQTSPLHTHTMGVSVEANIVFTFFVCADVVEPGLLLCSCHICLTKKPYLLWKGFLE